MRSRLLSFVVGAMLGSATLAASANDAKVQVLVESSSSGADGSGALFSGSLQKEINETGRHIVVASKDGAAFYVSISTMGMDDVSRLLKNGAMLSLYKVILLLRMEDGAMYYIDSWAGYMGQEKASSMASTISKALIKDIDDAVRAIQAAEPDAKK